MSNDSASGERDGPETASVDPSPDLVRQESPFVGAPAWSQPLIGWSIWRVVQVLIVVTLLVVVVLRARSVLSMLVIALFFGIAMLPAVNYFHQRRGWSRGAATATVFAILVAFVGVSIYLLIPGLVDAANAIGGQIPSWIDNINDTFNVEIDNGKAPEEISADIQATVQKWVQDNAQQVLGLASSTFGLICQAFTIATFTFYFAAGGQKMLHAYLGQLPPERQRRAGWAWDTAVIQTGGYFYSRSLLMIVNATLFFFVMLIVGMPWSLSLPLSIFVGFFSQFIPIIGTYVGAAVPIIITLGVEGFVPALILLIWVLIYQQLENYFLSPRISAKTMELNGGVAFGAALAGGAIAGPLGAFMALPVAALITAFIKQYARKYPVVYTSAYDDPEPLPVTPKTAN